MRVLIVSLNYAPEMTGFAPHATALAEHLGTRRHDVTVLAGFPFAPHWKRLSAYAGKWLGFERVNRVDLIRVSHFIPRRPGSVWQRLLMELTFAAIGLPVGIWHMAAGRKPDIVVYVGSQPGLAWLSKLLAALAGAPYLVEINDLAAEAAADVGIVRIAVLRRWLDRIEFGAYAGAAQAIVLCESFREALIEHGYDGAKVHVISLSVDLAHVRPGGDGQAFRAVAGIPPRAFLVLSSGSVGLKQGLADAVRAISRLRVAAPDIHLALVGDGEGMASVRALVERESIGDRVHLLPLQPEHHVRSMLAAADVLLVSQLNNVKKSAIPSKLLFYMAAGRPVIAAVNAASEAAAIMRQANGGLIVAPEDPSAIAAAIMALRADAGERERCGWRNRAYAERHFDRRRILLAKEHVITMALQQHGRTLAQVPQ